jgi:hypothetical protein
MLLMRTVLFGGLYLEALNLQEQADHQHDLIPVCRVGYDRGTNPATSELLEHEAFHARVRSKALVLGSGSSNHAMVLIIAKRYVAMCRLALQAERSSLKPSHFCITRRHRT